MCNFFLLDNINLCKKFQKGPVAILLKIDIFTIEGCLKKNCLVFIYLVNKINK